MGVFAQMQTCRRKFAMIVGYMNLFTWTFVDCKFGPQIMQKIKLAHPNLTCGSNLRLKKFNCEKVYCRNLKRHSILQVFWRMMPLCIQRLPSAVVAARFSTRSYNNLKLCVSLIFSFIDSCWVWNWWLDPYNLHACLNLEMGYPWTNKSMCTVINLVLIVVGCRFTW